MTRTLRFAPTLLLLSALLLAPAVARAEVVALQGARLIDGTGRPPVENAVLVVDGDHLAAAGPASEIKIPKGARVIDARGRTVIPGLINAHGHVGLVAEGQNRADAYTRENLKAQLIQYEQYGVTSILSLGLNRDLGYEVRDEQRRGAFPGASLFTAGRGVGAHPGCVLYRRRQPGPDQAACQSGVQGEDRQ